MVSITILTQNKYYTTSDMVSGRVIISSMKPINVQNISLKIIKEQRLKITFPNEKKNYNKNLNFDAYNYCKEFKLLGATELGSGQHIFPFKFVISEKDGGSTISRNIYQDSVIFLRISTKSFVNA